MDTPFFIALGFLLKIPRILLSAVLRSLEVAPLNLALEYQSGRAREPHVRVAAVGSAYKLHFEVASASM